MNKEEALKWINYFEIIISKCAEEELRYICFVLIKLIYKVSREDKSIIKLNEVLDYFKIANLNQNLETNIMMRNMMTTLDMPYKALDFQNTIVNLEVSNQDHYIKRAEMYIELNSYEKAVEDVEQALKKSKYNTHNIRRCLNLFIELKEYQKAIMCIEKLIKLEGISLEKLEEVINIAIKLKNYDRVYKEIIVSEKLLESQRLIFSESEYKDKKADLKEIELRVSHLVDEEKIKNKKLDVKIKSIEDIFKEIENESNLMKIEELVKEILIKDMYNKKAHMIIAFKIKNNHDRLEYIEEVKTLFKKKIGSKHFEELIGHFWLAEETRDYMDIRKRYALELKNQGYSLKAISELESMLELDPNDNLEVRHNLITLYLEENMLRKARELFNAYKKEESSYWRYSEALYMIKSFQIEDIEKYLKLAFESNLNIAKQIIQKSKLYEELKENILEVEVKNYVEENSNIWIDTKDALNILETQYNKYLEGRI